MPTPAPLITALVHADTLEASSAAPVPWWSFTKTVLAAAALVLVAEGRLCLDAPVRGRAFSLRQLLQHRSGLPDYGGVVAYHAAVAGAEAPWPVDELLRRARADRMLFPPGEGWAYSNIGYLLVRRMIERVADAPLDDALRRLVLAPLGIARTAIALTPETLAATEWGNARGYHPGWVYHGLLVGPAGDAALLLHRLLGGGLLPPALLDQMRTMHPLGGRIPGRPWRAVGYGLGLAAGETAAGRFVGHSGAGPGSTSAVYSHAGRGGMACTAAAFAPVETQGATERKAVALASGGRIPRNAKGV